MPSVKMKEGFTLVDFVKAQETKEKENKTVTPREALGLEDEGVLTLLKSLVAKLQGKTSVPLVKSVDEEQRLALFIALAPNEVDAHGHTITALECEKACNNWAENCGRMNFMHKVDIEKSTVVQNFCAPCDFETENGVEIVKGTWLQWHHFPEENEDSATLWELVKSGDINGLSIKCSGSIFEEQEA